MAVGLIGGDDGGNALQEVGTQPPRVGDVVRGLDVVLLRAVQDRRGVGEALDVPSLPLLVQEPAAAEDGSEPSGVAEDGTGLVANEDEEVRTGELPYVTEGERVDVSITFYTCPPYCATTASGELVHVGGAACGYGFALGQEFLLAGSRYTCNDRGLGPSYWVDIFFWDEAEGYAWLAQVGSYGTVILP